uniref:DUF1995 domain-containing protein n=1 Tax=Fibrocapsa japonica TaxID=94617 RepID=A0A7S2V4A5_9STRA
MSKILDRSDRAPGGSNTFIGDKIGFGALGSDFVDSEDDVFLVISLQSGNVYDSLVDSIKAVGDKPIVLINPPSQGETTSIAGSFESCFHFRLLYPPGASFFPILGALSQSGPQQPYVVLKNEEKHEIYKTAAAFDSMPTSEELVKAVND